MYHRLFIPIGIHVVHFYSENASSVNPANVSLFWSRVKGLKLKGFSHNPNLTLIDRIGNKCPIRTYRPLEPTLTMRVGVLSSQYQSSRCTAALLKSMVCCTALPYLQQSHRIQLRWQCT